MFFRQFFVRQREDAEKIHREIKDDFITGLYQKKKSYPVLSIKENLYGSSMATYFLIPCDTGVLNWVRKEYFEYTGLNEKSR